MSVACSKTTGCDVRKWRKKVLERQNIRPYNEALEIRRINFTMAMNMLRALIPSAAAADIEMNDLEAGGSRIAVTHRPEDSSRGQPQASAPMDVGPDSQQLHSAAPVGQPPASHLIRPPQPALQPAPVPHIVPQPMAPHSMAPQPVPPQPNPNHHTPAPQAMPPAPIAPHIVPPHNITPRPASQSQSGTTAQPIPAQPNVSQPQQSTVFPFRFDLRDPPLPYIFGSAANDQNANTSEIAPQLGKRNRPADEDPKKIRVIRHPSVSIKISAFCYC